MRNDKIVTAMACVAASMLAGLTLAPSAMAAGGWGIDGGNILDKYGNKTIVVTYRTTVDKASITDPADNTVHSYGTFTDGIHFTTITDQDKVDIRAYGFTVKKAPSGNVNTLPDGAWFQIQRNGKWMKFDPNPNPTGRCRRTEGNRPARPNEPQTSPSPPSDRHPAGDGRTA